MITWEKFAKYRKKQMPLTEVGGFHSLMAVSLMGSIPIFPWPMIIPRNFMCGASKVYLESLSDRPCSLRQSRTCQVYL